MRRLNITLDHHCGVFEGRIEAFSRRNGFTQSPKLEAQGSSTQPGKIEMHALGGDCAGEARVAASLLKHSIG